MTWQNDNSNENQNETTLTLVKDGNTHTKVFQSGTTVKDAVNQLTGEYGVKTFEVKDQNGNDINDTADADKDVTAYSRISIEPSTTGAL